MKQIFRYSALLLALCILCIACQGHIGLAPSTEEPTKLPTDAPTEVPTEAPTASETISEDEPLIAGDEIVQAFALGTTVLADLDGDGEMEQITAVAGEESGDYIKEIEIQIGEHYFDWETINALLDGVGWYTNHKTFYLIDLDPTDNWLEIGLFDSGAASYERLTAFLRYCDGELVHIGTVPAGSPEDTEGVYFMEIPGDGTVRGGVRYDVLQTSFVTKTWKLENAAEFHATLEEVVPEYYVFELREEDDKLTLTQDTTFFASMSENQNDLIILSQGTKVDIARFYPETGWIQLVYEQGKKAVWLRRNEERVILPLSVSEWDMGTYLDGLALAG